MQRQSTRRGTPWHQLRLVTLFVTPWIFASGCRESAPDDVFVDEETTEAIVFVKTDGEETLNRSWASGNLYKLSPISPDGAVTPLTDYQGASISDPEVSFDGKRVLFSMRPPGASQRNIYEIGVDGTGLRQVTSGGGHDFDPVYLPDGRILFTSSRHRHMDEYNHSPAENLYRCNADGSGLERVSFNQSDDFDPVLLPSGRVAYTRWDHFGTFNRFPLFATNPDGTGIFHHYGPHDRNFFHVQPTPNGRLVAIESTMINEDAGPIAVLKVENGPADPVTDDQARHWSVLNAQVNTDGAPWPYGAFKYPFPLGDNEYVASYTLPAAADEEVDYALYTFTLNEIVDGDDVRVEIHDLTFLYNDPTTNEYDAQLIAPRVKPPVIEDQVDPAVSWGIFTAQDVFNRSQFGDGQERPRKGIDTIDEIAVIAARPTIQGEPNDFSANEFEKRALLGFAPVQPDGSFSIRVPADTPITFATLDEHRRGFVVKRTWLAVRPGEHFSQCTGCHEDRGSGDGSVTNPDPMALASEPTDLTNATEQIINYRDVIGPIVAEKCVSCHSPGFSEAAPDSVAGGLDLTDVMEVVMRENQTFPRGYLNLSGESMSMESNVTVPAFPRRSRLIDYVLGLGSRAGSGPHPDGMQALTPSEQELFNLWVLLGAQYR